MFSALTLTSKTVKAAHGPRNAINSFGDHPKILSAFAHVYSIGAQKSQLSRGERDLRTFAKIPTDD